ncbi:outer membrane autotransporter protein [Pseudomonas sp. TE3786]
MKTLLAFTFLALACSQASAATITVADGSNLGDTTVVPASTAGDRWILQGNANLFGPGASPAANFARTLPVGVGLTIEAAAGGSVITLNNGASAFGNFTGSGTVTVNVVGDLTFTGGSRPSAGGSLFTGTNLNLNASEGSTITISGNQGLGTGGAIYANGHLNLATTSGNVVITNNHSSQNGGALYSQMPGGLAIGNANGTVLITDNSAGLISGANANYGHGALGNGGGNNFPLVITGRTVTISRNQAAGMAGAIRSTGAIIINGDLFADANAAGLAGTAFDGGAFSSGVGVTVNGSTSMTNNTTTGRGGAIFAAVAATSPGNISLSLNGGDVTLQNNIAGQAGGAIFTNTNIDVAIGNAAGEVTITGNRAGYNAAGQALSGVRDGGAIANLGAGVETLIRGRTITLSNNLATGRGGAIYSDAPLRLDGSLIAQGNSAGTLGGVVWAAGNLTLAATSGDMTFSGNSQGTASTARANALYLNNGGGSAVATFFADSGNAIRFLDPITSNAANGLLSVVSNGPGLVSFDGSQYSSAADRWSTVYANTSVQAGTFEVANNAVYGVHASTVGRPAPSVFTTAAGSTLQGGSSGTVIADQLTLGGDLSLGGRQTARSFFTLDSQQLTFAPGSQVFFNTFLEPGQPTTADLLVLELGGNAVNGETALRVGSLAGLGGPTSGLGVQVVQGNNGTTAGAFTLGSRVAAGVYEYSLFYGADPVTGGDPADQNWYLRSTRVASDPEEASLPNYRDEVPVNLAVPAMLNRLGLAMLGTYHDRVGADQYPQVTADPSAQPATWSRVYGQRGSVGYDHGGSASSRLQSFTRNGPTYDYTVTGMAAGADLYRHANTDGSHDSAGAYVAVGRASADVAGVYGGNAGTSGVNGYSLGGYWNRKGDSGAYLDTVVQATWYDNLRARSSQGESAEFRAYGLLGSLEGGYPIELGGNVVVEPQAQVIHQHTGIDDGADRFARIDQGNLDMTYGRLGVRLVHQQDRQSGRPLTTWLRLNAWQAFGSDASTTFSAPSGRFPVTLHADMNGSWGQAGLGVSGLLQSNLEVFASTDYNLALDGDNSHGVEGRVGLNWTW